MNIQCGDILLHVTYWTKTDPAEVYIYMYFSIYIHKKSRTWPESEDLISRPGTRASCVEYCQMMQNKVFYKEKDWWK